MREKNVLYGVGIDDGKTEKNTAKRQPTGPRVRFEQLQMTDKRGQVEKEEMSTGKKRQETRAA